MDMEGFLNEPADLGTIEHDRSHTKCGESEALLG